MRIFFFRSTTRRVRAAHRCGPFSYSIEMLATDTLASLALKELGFFGTLLCATIGLLLCTPLFLQRDAAEASAARNNWIWGKAGEVR